MAATVHYDRERLRESLAALGAWRRIAFAASCVEVLVPSYVRFCEIEMSGDPAFVRATADAVWSTLEVAGSYVVPDLPSVDAVKELLPTDEDWNDWAPQAEDAIASLAYLVELAWSNDAENAFTLRIGHMRRWMSLQRASRD